MGGRQTGLPGVLVADEQKGDDGGVGAARERGKGAVELQDLLVQQVEVAVAHALHKAVVALLHRQAHRLAPHALCPLVPARAHSVFLFLF